MLQRFCTVAILLLVIIEALAQQIAPAPPGKLVDVDGTRLHIDCTGPQRGPSVILISGIGDYSFDWELVQPRLGSSNQVCSYDRAGMAWSDADHAEPNLAHLAQQLVNLLRAAKVPAPYIFVGHSWGGAIARIAANLVSTEVAGIVLVDSTHEDEILGINDTAVRPRALSAADWAKVWSRPMPGAPGGPPSGALTMKRRVPSIQPPYTHLPKQAQLYRLWALSRPRSMDTGDLRSDLMTLFASRGGKDHPLGKLPLIVITPTAEPYEAEGEFTADQLKDDHLRLQADLVKLSRRGKHLFAKRSGHHVQLDDPAVVVEATEEVIRQAKRVSRRPAP